jgi:rhodanese-related sulfurtransferase
MDQAAPTILPDEFNPLLGAVSAPVLVDLRSAEQISTTERLIPGAIRRSPADVQTWWTDLPPGRAVVVFDLSGAEKSSSTAETLRRHGLHARHLDGGFAAWRERKLPTRRVTAANEAKWVTRERPKIDRIACPWLVRRFINPSAEFIYVPKSRVLAVAAETGATPYDIDGVEFGHVGERCSFDAILRIYDLDIPPLDHLATIVRGADTSRHDLAQQCGGLVAISLGLSANFPDDHDMLEHGMIVYDALYSWCRSLPPAEAGGAT